MLQSERSALIVVDVQNGFTSGGNLEVAHAEQIIPTINQLARHFDNIVLTQDWHPENHISFVENHPNRKAYELIQLDYGPQVLWPSHCVQGTQDAEFHPDLNIPTAQLIIRKGF
ncbi:MAG: isochorismatase family protein, partial [Acinetobacter guillouiae]